MPRRADGLFGRIANFGALIDAARRAARGKRRKPGTAAFLANQEREVLRLEHQLQSGAWRPGGYVEIEVREPKRRLVSAAPFRDRVVHHALCAVVEPLFERGFIDDSYANRRDKGTHRAIARYEQYRDRYAYVLRCDIFALFAQDAATLDGWRQRIADYLQGRRLLLHPDKTFVASCAESARFLGLELLPGGQRRLPEEAVRRFRNRLRGLRDRWRAGTVNEEEVRQRIQAWCAHARHADTYRLRRAIFRGGWFDPSDEPPRGPGGPGVPSACCGAVPGTTIHRTFAPRTATGTPRRTGTTTTGSAFRVHADAGAGAVTAAPGEHGCVQGPS